MRIIIRAPKNIKVSVTEDMLPPAIPPKPPNVAGAGAPLEMRKMQDNIQTALKRSDERQTPEQLRKDKELEDWKKSVDDALAQLTNTKPGGNLKDSIKNITEPKVTTPPAPDKKAEQTRGNDIMAAVKKKPADAFKAMKFLGRALGVNPVKK